MKIADYIKESEQYSNRSIYADDYDTSFDTKDRQIEKFRNALKVTVDALKFYSDDFLIDDPTEILTGYIDMDKKAKDALSQIESILEGK